MTIELQPEIFPTACDALQLEWENDKDEYLEMEILEGSEVWFTFVQNFVNILLIYL